MDFKYFLCCARGVRHPPTLYFWHSAIFVIMLFLVHCSNGPDEISALPTSQLGSYVITQPRGNVEISIGFVRQGSASDKIAAPDNHPVKHALLIQL